MFVVVGAAVVFAVQLHRQLPPDNVRERILAPAEAPRRSQQHRREGRPRAQHLPDQHLEIPGEVLHAVSWLGTTLDASFHEHSLLDLR